MKPKPTKLEKENANLRQQVTDLKAILVHYVGRNCIPAGLHQQQWAASYIKEALDAQEKIFS